MLKNFALDFDFAFNEPYEALICYANITEEFLEIDSGLIPECGYCRTCFRRELRDNSAGKMSLCCGFYYKFCDANV